MNKNWKTDQKVFLTYEEILQLEEEEAKELFLERHTLDLKGLLEEMIDHEEKYQTLRNSDKSPLTSVKQFFLDFFDRTKYVRKMKQNYTLEKYTDSNLLDDAMFMKFATDKVLKK
ncbi:MAG: hypothetical protein Q8O95_05395 [bacterium]|nr:hypothetical protein [bacterium]